MKNWKSYQKKDLMHGLYCTEMNCFAKERSLEAFTCQKLAFANVRCCSSEVIVDRKST